MNKNIKDMCSRFLFLVVVVLIPFYAHGETENPTNEIALDSLSIREQSNVCHHQAVEQIMERNEIGSIFWMEKYKKCIDCEPEMWMKTFMRTQYYWMRAIQRELVYDDTKTAILEYINALSESVNLLDCIYAEGRDFSIQVLPIVLQSLQQYKLDLYELQSDYGYIYNDLSSVVIKKLNQKMFDIFPYEELSDILIQIKFDDLSEQGRINCILENHAAYASSISEMETILNTNTIILIANNIYELASLIEEENPKDAVPYYSNIIDGKYPELSLHTYLFALLHYHRIKDGTKPLAENTSFTTILLNKLKDESYIENIGVFLSFVHLNNVIDIEPFIPYYEKYFHNGGKIDSWGMQQLLKIYIQNKEYSKFGRLYSTAYSGNDNIVSNQFGSMDYLLKYGECALVYNNAISTNDLYNK